MRSDSKLTDLRPALRQSNREIAPHVVIHPSAEGIRVVDKALENRALAESANRDWLPGVSKAPVTNSSKQAVSEMMRFSGQIGNLSADFAVKLY